MLRAILAHIFAANRLVAFLPVRAAKPAAVSYTHLDVYKRQPLIRFDMTFATYYAKKRGEGKPHRVAITHVAKKLIRVIYALESQDCLLYTSRCV